nr:amidohydrolase family protein [uncultured Carboxylicivirga sp.]
MKFLKKLLYTLLSIVLVVWFASLVILQLEKNQSAYLKIENHPDLEVNSYIISNVNIIPMTADTVLENMTVWVDEGVIKEMSNTKLSVEVPIIDGKGGYLTPGLIDMHVHLWDRFELGLYLANGVTTIRSLLGMPFHLEVKEQLQKSEIIGPEFYTSSPQFSGPEDGDIFHKQVNTPEEAAQLVIKYKEVGYDYIKTYNLLPKHLFDAVLDQATLSGIPVIAHPSFLVDYKYHFDDRISTVEHTEDIYQQALNYQYDREKLQEIVNGYARSGQTHCPTITVFYNLTEIYNKGEAYLQSEQVAYLNSFVEDVGGDYKRHMAIRLSDSTSVQRINEQQQFHMEILQKLHQAGVNIVAGTDAGIVNTAAGFSIHQELGFYVQAGMSNYEALKTATINPSKVYEEYSNFGTIDLGKHANLILTEDNPLKDLSTLKNPRWVMIKGRKIENDLMQQFKDKAANRKNYLATMIKAISYVLWGK